MNHVRNIVRAAEAHRQGITGKGINIAIVDTGLSLHPDFQSRITGWYDALKGNPSPYDDSGHGSHVAGIAAGDGRISRGLYKGIAPEAGLIGVKVLNKKGNGTISDIMRGLNWILHNKERFQIRIVNISIGANDKKTFDENCDFVKKVNLLWDAGIVVIAAAGNKGPNRQTISAPGNSRKIITVGSSDVCGTAEEPELSHSGIGPTLSCIKKPDVVAPGSRIISCSAGSENRHEQYYSMKSGTSMSTPIVTGAVALLLSKYPEMTPREVKIRLKNSCTDLNLPHEKQGWGLLNIAALL